MILRPSTERDAAAIREVYSEPDVRRWMGWDPKPPDEGEARANIERAASAWDEGSWAVFRIVDAATDQVVGGVNLRLCEYQIAEVSYFLRGSARGRGLATRAFHSSRVGRSTSSASNASSCASTRGTLRRAAWQSVRGFTREGVERASRAWPDGTRFDSILFSLIVTDALE